MPSKDPQKRKAAYARWYAKHGKAHNERRRIRYHTDAEYRERMKQLSAQTKATKRGSRSSDGEG